MEDWKFEVTEAAGALGIPKIIPLKATDRTEKEVVHDDPEDIKRWIAQADKLYEWPMTRGDVKKKIFREIGRQTNSNIQQADLDIAMNKNYLVESTIKSGNGSYMLQIGDVIPF